MARRNKRASMREGPLADLFRSTEADAPEDPPEAPGAFFDQDQEPPAASPPPPPPAREEPVAREPEPPAREPEPEPRRPDPPESDESAPERLKRVFAEEPRPRQTSEEFMQGPRYGREEPAYE